MVSILPLISPIPCSLRCSGYLIPCTVFYGLLSAVGEGEKVLQKRRSSSPSPSPPHGPISSSYPPPPPPPPNEAVGTHSTISVGPTPPLLLRLSHIATASCGCLPRVHLQAQAQAQPRALTPEVVCTVQGVRASTGAQLLVLALAHSTNIFCLRFQGASWSPDIDEGDYLYEWSDGTGGQSKAGSRIVCMSLTPDLMTLLCVTRDGTAYSFSVGRLLETATRVYSDEIIGQERWTGHLDPSLLEYTKDPKYARETNGPSSPAASGRKAVILGSTSVSGDFVPHCCTWWGTKGYPMTAIVGGSVGESSVLSIVDMEGEREIELLFVQSPQEAEGGGSVSYSRVWGDVAANNTGPITRLTIHPDYSLDLPPAEPEEEGGPRHLFIEVKGGSSIFSLCLEAVFEAKTLPHSPSSSSSSLQQQLYPSRSATPASAQPLCKATPTRRGPLIEHLLPAIAQERLNPSLPTLRLSIGGGGAEESSYPPTVDPASPLLGLDMHEVVSPILSTFSKQEDDQVQSLCKPEIGTGSLWERCFTRSVGSPASPMPGAPRHPSITVWSEWEKKAQQEAEGEEARHLLLRVLDVDGDLAVLRGKTVRRRSRSLRHHHWRDLEHEEEVRTTAFQLDLLIYRPSSTQGGSMGLHHERHHHHQEQASIEKRALASLDLGPVAWQDQLGDLVIDEVLSATADEETLVLSCTAVGTKEERSASSAWLLIFHVPPLQSSSSSSSFEREKQEQAPSLLRAFCCPTTPLVFLHWLPLSHLTLQDTLNLAEQGFSPKQDHEQRQDEDKGGAKSDVMVSTLLIQSRCTLYSLRTFCSSSRSLTHKAVMPPELPSPSPGAVIELVESIAQQGRLHEAIHLSWALLQGVTAGRSPCPLPPAHVTDIAAADHQMQEVWGRARLAKKCVEWMILADDWPSQDLLAFLESNQDYDLDDVVDLLIATGKVSEALRGSWAAGGAEAVVSTISRLAMEVDLPLTDEDMIWLGQEGPGQALLSVAQGGLAANLPPAMRLAVIFQDSDLLIKEPSQYEWLLTSLPTLPPSCLKQLVGHLMRWLHIGSSDWPSQAWLEQWRSEGPIAALKALEEGLLPIGDATEETSSLPADLDTSAQEKQCEEEGPAVEQQQQQQHEEGKEEQPADGSTTKVTKLSQLLLFSLLLMSKPVRRTYGACWSRGSVLKSPPPTCIGSLDENMAEAVAAQYLLERLVSAWVSSSGVKGVPPAWETTSRRFTPALLLCLALESDNVGCAAILLDAYGRRDQALDLRLNELKEVAAGRGDGHPRSEEETCLLLDNLMALVRAHVLRPPPMMMGMPQRLGMLTRLLEAWAEMGLPVERLEEEANEGGSMRREVKEEPWAAHILLPLLIELLVLQAPATTTGGVEQEGDQPATGIAALPFSEGFLIKLCHHVVDHGIDLQEQGVTDRWGAGGPYADDQGVLRPARRQGALWQSFYEQVQSLADDDPTYVTVTERELAEASLRVGAGGSYFAGSNLIMRSTGTTGSGYSRTGASVEERRLLVFSCGHIMTRREMLQRSVPEMESQLRSSPLLPWPLNLTAELLCKEYQDTTSRSLSLACPACVTAFLISLAGEGASSGQTLII